MKYLFLAFFIPAIATAQDACVAVNTYMGAEFHGKPVNELRFFEPNVSVTVRCTRRAKAGYFVAWSDDTGCIGRGDTILGGFWSGAPKPYGCIVTRLKKPRGTRGKYLPKGEIVFGPAAGGTYKGEY